MRDFLKNEKSEIFANDFSLLKEIANNSYDILIKYFKIDRMDYGFIEETNTYYIDFKMYKIIIRTYVSDYMLINLKLSVSTVISHFVKEIVRRCDDII